MTVHACFTLYAASMTTMGEKVMFVQTQIAQREGLALLNKFNLSPSAVPIEYITSRDSFWSGINCWIYCLVEPWPDFYPQTTYVLFLNLFSLNSFSNLLTCFLPTCSLNSVCSNVCQFLMPNGQINYHIGNNGLIKYNYVSFRKQCFNDLQLA